MRRPRPLDRSAKPVRDASLVVIASEDKYAVRQYFDFFRSTRVQFRVLETADCMSAPEHVLRRLNRYAEEFDIRDGDELWLVCDTDHWAEPNHIKNLTDVLRQCRQKGYRVALSNPCFDTWLLLHFTDLPAGGKTLTCDAVARLLRAAAGGYDKTKVYNLPITDAHVSAAVNRAETMHAADCEIPDRPQTGVHLIIRSLVGRSIIEVHPRPGKGGQSGRRRKSPP